jgi:four helix bundle protein
MTDQYESPTSSRIRRHTDLEVYRKAFDAAMRIFELSKTFPAEEKYSLTDQVRRSSRSVCTNLAEAWRKRRYEGAFISKCSDSETEAGETQSWLEFAVKCQYLDRDIGAELYRTYDEVISTLVGMMNYPETWLLKTKRQ